MDKFTPENSTVYQWDDVPEESKAVIIESSAIALGTEDVTKVRYIYDKFKPMMIVRDDNSDSQVCFKSRFFLLDLITEFIKR